MAPFSARRGTLTIRSERPEVPRAVPGKRRSELRAVAVGQEGFASIRRPSTWNSIVGMRPTAGLVSRGGVYAGWPSIAGSLGPMARTVTDLAKLLDVIVGYDPEDPVTARGCRSCT